MSQNKESGLARRIGLVASIATIVGTCIAVIALIPAFGQWLSPGGKLSPPTEVVKTPTLPLKQTLTPANLTVTPTTHDTSVLFTVPASPIYNDTGISINVGDSIELKYQQGKWTYWAGTIPLTDAMGNAGYICTRMQPASKCLEPVPDAPAGSLIARIGATKPFSVGNQSTFTAANAGSLILGMNDLDLTGNQGSIVVSITVTRAR